MKKNRFQILLVYTLLVIVWGAWVRISHSGDGCGESWPLCQGELLPDGTQKKTWIEYAHRLMSGAFGIWVIVLWFQVRKATTEPRFRRTMNAVLFFMITEALLGAKLVLFGLVGMNASWGRTFAMSLHQINSLLLTGAVAWLAFEAGAMKPTAATAPTGRRPTSTEGRKFGGPVWLTTIIFGVIAVTGAWAALAGTLFPSESLRDGLVKDFAPDAHHLLRLRVLHPLSAVLGAGGLSMFFWMRSMDDNADFRLHRETALIFLGAVIFGMLTLLMLSPPWMKLTHLTIAHVAWIALLRWVRFRDPSLVK